MNKFAIILLLIALTSCVTPKKFEAIREEPIPALEETATFRADREAWDKIYKGIDKLYKRGYLTGGQYKDSVKQFRYDLMMALMLGECGGIKNDKARQKCSEKVFNDGGGIDYIEGK